MNKILFVCHGNICRSPMAEMVMKDIVRINGCEDDFYIDSCAMTTEEIGNGMHRGTREILDRYNVPYTDHRARLIRQNDFKTFDYIIAMDRENLDDIDYIIPSQYKNKVYRILDFAKIKRDVADPWYTHNFEQTYADIKLGCNKLFECLKG